MSPAVLITGATAGLGRKAAYQLALAGHDVIVGGRRPEAVRAVCASIEAGTGRRALPFVADLASLEEVRAALRGLDGVPLQGIVANAGITTLRDARSADGFELTFAVNVLSHQLLLCALADQLVDGARVVVVSSGVHEPSNQLARRAGIPVPRWVGTRELARPDDAAPEARLEDGRQRYSTSKLANVLQARGLQAKLRQRGQNVDVFAIDPGLMVDTQLARELPAPLRVVFQALGRLATPFVDNMRTSDTSAAHICALVTDPSWRDQGFAYLDGDHVKPPSDDALRDDLVAELWRDTQPMIDARLD